MILAAGLGTRLKPLTDNKPKALVEFCQKPLLEIIIMNLKKHGFTDIIINVHHFANQIIKFIGENNAFDINIYFSDERNQLLDTGGAIKNASIFFNNEDVLIHNVDILSDLNLKSFFEHHKKTKSLATLAVKDRTTSRQLLFDNDNQLCAWKNIETNEIKQYRQTKRKLYPTAFSGVHIISPEMIKLMTENGVFSIIDDYLRLAENHKITSYKHNETSWFDLGRKENIEKAEENFKKFGTSILF